jgi:hypothetical protein
MKMKNAMKSNFNKPKYIKKRYIVTVLERNNLLINLKCNRVSE